MTKLKQRIGYIFLALFIAIVGLFSVQALTPTKGAKAESVGIFTMSPSAKAENGHLTFRVWIDKENLSEYMQLVPLTHTYFNVIVDGAIDENISHSAEGVNYTNWKFNLSDESNAGFGVFDIVVSVADKPTSKICVVFGYTNVAGQEIDVFSDTVTYAGVYNSPAEIEELEMQISFLEKTLAKVNAESYANYERYKAVQDELDRVKTEYEQLKGEEKIKAWGVLVSVILIGLAVITLSTLAIVKTLQSYAHWALKLIICVVIVAVLVAVTWFITPEILAILSTL